MSMKGYCRTLFLDTASKMYAKYNLGLFLRNSGVELLFSAGQTSTRELDVKGYYVSYISVCVLLGRPRGLLR
jgi:hypothetical protein